MEFKKLNAPSLRELFVNELQNMILSGKLEIGSKLPPERELAESMKVSRAVINSGIAELEKNGSPRAEFFTDEDRRAMRIRIPIHPAFLEEGTDITETEEKTTKKLLKR